MPSDDAFLQGTKQVQLLPETKKKKQMVELRDYEVSTLSMSK